MGSVELHTHQLTSLTHLHEAWMMFIRDRVYKASGTVLTLGTLKNYPIFSEFASAGAAVMKLYRPHCEPFNDWATLVRQGVGSDWHHHISADWVLVYYPQDQTGMGDLLVGTESGGKEPGAVPVHRITPTEGTCAMFRGDVLHMIEKNPSKDLRYSLVLMFKEKR